MRVSNLFWNSSPTLKQAREIVCEKDASVRYKKVGDAMLEMEERRRINKLSVCQEKEAVIVVELEERMEAQTIAAGGEKDSVSAQMEREIKWKKLDEQWKGQRKNVVDRNYVNCMQVSC